MRADHHRHQQEAGHPAQRGGDEVERLGKVEKHSDPSTEATIGSQSQKITVPALFLLDLLEKEYPDAG
jgi:hypothetical protein